MTAVPRTVLHVDDDADMRRIVKVQLERLGFHVISLENPDDALSTILRTDCRVVLLDVNMPQQNGLELLREIKRTDGGIQVIMLTGLISVQSLLQSMRWGAEACFFKPVPDFQPISEALDAVFEKIDRWWTALADLHDRKEIAVPAASR